MEQREKFEEQTRAKLDEWNARIDKLVAEAREAEAKRRGELLEEVDVLKSRRDKAREKLDELRASGEGAWGEIKTGVERAVGEMEQALDKARSRFE